MFPLTAEQQTINLVQRTVLLAGIALVALVLIIALLVTRQVVRPVRVAAQTAGRLAAGDLSKRIAVHGSDDIGRLGQSFNEMADSLQRQIRRLEELSRLQRRFTSDVSHELRTPLTTIRMAAEYLHRSRDRLRAGAVPRRRAAARRTRPVRGAARRPAGDLPLRRRRRAARLGAGGHPRRRALERRGEPDARRAARHRDRGGRCRTRDHRRHGRAAGRTHSAQPASATRSTTVRAGR